MRREPDALGVIAVLAVQVPEQEHQWKRERPEDHGSPCPDYEAASSPLGNSTGKIDRGDRSDRQQCGENGAIEGDVGAHGASSAALDYL